MTAVRWQGALYCLSSLLLIAATALVGRGDQQSELIVLAVLIVTLGVPHGALDTVFAWRQYRLQDTGGWIAFTLAYLVPVAVVIGIWALAPLVFLIGFLVISAVHFSGDPPDGTAIVTRALYGAAIIILPTLTHAGEVRMIFALIADEIAAGWVLEILQALAWPWLAAAICAALHRAWTDPLAGTEIFATVLVAALVPPLLAFTMFFCVMHSARHIVRTVGVFRSVSGKWLLVAAGIPIIGIIALSVAAWQVLGDQPLDLRILQLIFVGLAALTVPHMAIVERVRLSGWTTLSARPTA